MIPDLLARLVSAPDLAEPLPAEPMPVLWRWLLDARDSGEYDDPWAMTLATATPLGVPSARVVLCKRVCVPDASFIFFTSYESRKAADLAVNPHAAAVFHWPHAGRQARIEGTASRLSARESADYFASRPLLSRIGAHVSRQSRPIASRAELIHAALRRAVSAAVEGDPIERPDWWGGFRLLALRVELWSACPGRLHHRVRWERAAPGAPWLATILSP